jgi:hypothetical protein
LVQAHTITDLFLPLSALGTQPPGLRELEMGLARMIQLQWRARAARRELAALTQHEELEKEAEVGMAAAEEEQDPPPTRTGWLHKLSVDNSVLSLLVSGLQVQSVQTVL